MLLAIFVFHFNFFLNQAIRGGHFSFYAVRKPHSCLFVTSKHIRPIPNSVLSVPKNQNKQKLISTPIGSQVQIVNYATRAGQFVYFNIITLFFFSFIYSKLVHIYSRFPFFFSNKYMEWAHTKLTNICVNLVDLLSNIWINLVDPFQ